MYSKMNWLKLKEKYPKAYEELKTLHSETGNDGEFLLDEYLRLNGKEYILLRLPALQEIEDSLIDSPRSLNGT